MRSSNGNTEQVAPSSAPMLQMVAFAGARDALGAGAEILDDLVGAALDGEHSAELEDDVLRRRPAVELAGQLHADDARQQHLPREAGHHVDRVGAADADRAHAEPARVRRVRVGADHQPAGERVVLEHDLVDDARARLPEADAVLRRDRCEEVVDLRVFRTSARLVSAARPTCAWIRWSQCTVAGTATSFLPACMNCSSAICAVASCMATRSGRELDVAAPAVELGVVGVSRWPYTIFSASVSGRPSARARRRAVRASCDTFL